MAILAKPRYNPLVDVYVNVKAGIQAVQAIDQPME